MPNHEGELASPVLSYSVVPMIPSSAQSPTKWQAGNVATISFPVWKRWSTLVPVVAFPRLASHDYWEAAACDDDGNLNRLEVCYARLCLSCDCLREHYCLSMALFSATASLVEPRSTKLIVSD